MVTPQSNSWLNLFAPDDGKSPAETVELRVVNRRGEPFLILPAEPTLATQSLQLYSAQSFRARLAKKVLHTALRKGRKMLSTQATLRVQLHDPFIHFLQNFSQWPDSQVPPFGILAGNPSAAGRRFILLLFNPKQTPVTVVKVGLDGTAKKLIELESNFLASIAGGTPGIPVLRGRFEYSRLNAIAMDFFDGTSPRAEDEAGIPALLTSWVNRHKTMALGLMRTWWELEQTCADHPVFAKLAQRLPNQIVRPTIFHGDFAPWNCKVANGGWRVLDWERGDLAGPPGYDWFHYLVQTRILVAKKSTNSIVNELLRLLESSEFHEYARRAGFLASRRDLLLMYLLHHNEVIQPGEGLDAGRKLLKALAARF
jgi:hypothetical protein